MSDKCHCGESRRKTFTIKELKMEISELKKKIKDDDWRWEQYFEQKKTIDELKKQLEERVCNHINAPYRAVIAERDELKKRENNYLKTIGEGTATIKELRQQIGVMESENSELKKRVGELETVLSAWQSQFGTTQLTHAISKLESYQSLCKELAEALGAMWNLDAKEDYEFINRENCFTPAYVNALRLTKQALEKYRERVK